MSNLGLEDTNQPHILTLKFSAIPLTHNYSDVLLPLDDVLEHLVRDLLDLVRLELMQQPTKNLILVRQVACKGRHFFTSMERTMYIHQMAHYRLLFEMLTFWLNYLLVVDLTQEGHPA